MRRGRNRQAWRSHRRPGRLRKIGQIRKTRRYAAKGPLRPLRRIVAEHFGGSVVLDDLTYGSLVATRFCWIEAREWSGNAAHVRMGRQIVQDDGVRPDIRVFVVAGSVADDLGRNMAVHGEPFRHPLPSQRAYHDLTSGLFGDGEQITEFESDDCVVGPGLADESQSFDVVVDILVFPDVQHGSLLNKVAFGVRPETYRPEL